MALNLQHQTAAEFTARLRQRYLISTREECARLATWIIDRITAGDITDTQVRNAFGLSAAQYTTLKAKLDALRTNWLAVRAAAGE